MKTCFKCSTVKPLDDFYKHSMMADGHVNKCKECNKKDVRERYQATIDERHAYDRARNALPHRIEARKEYASRPDVMERHVEYTRYRRFEVEPEKYKARTAVSNAIRDGRLVRGDCVRCGTTENIHGHHHDYSRPLDVEWLCASCHSLEHKEIR